MKKLLFLIMFVIFENLAFPQTPQAFKYQAAVRRINGDMVVNQAVAFRISILSGSISGPIAYSERQPATTNAFGLVTLEIGRGTVLSGSFTNIAWGATSHFVKVEVDTTGGTNYQFMGSSELLSVPYSFSANTATDDHDRDSTNELQMLSKPNDTTISLSKGGGSVSIAAGGIASGNCILSSSLSPPNGYIFSGSYMNATEIWTYKTNVPSYATAVECASLGGKIYLVGGIVAPGDPSNQEYDPETNLWTTKAPLPALRYSHGLVSCNSKLYAIGGEESGVTKSDVYEYDPVTNSWISKAPMPSPRQLFAISVANNKIYVIGGESNQILKSEVFEYNPISNQWSTKASLPAPRSEMGAATVNNKIYVFGGRTTGNVFIYSTIEYNPVTNIWTQKSNMQTPRNRPAVADNGNKIYVIGGETNPGGPSNLNEEYDPLSDTWISRMKLLQTGYDQISSSVANKIYVFDNQKNQEYLVPLQFFLHCKN